MPARARLVLGPGWRLSLGVSLHRGHAAAQPRTLVQQGLHVRPCAPPRGVRGERDLPLPFRSLLAGRSGGEGEEGGHTYLSPFLGSWLPGGCSRMPDMRVWLTGGRETTHR